MADTQIVQMLVKGQNDISWFDANFNNLLSEYDEQFIAFKDKKVLDSDPRLNRLMEKLKEKNINVSDVFIEFVSKIKHIL